MLHPCADTVARKQSNGAHTSEQSMAKSQPTTEPRTHADAAGLRHSIKCHDSQAGFMKQAEQQQWLLAACLHVSASGWLPCVPTAPLSGTSTHTLGPSTHSQQKRSPVSTRSTALRVVEPFESLVLQLTQGRCLGALQLRYCQVEDEIGKLSPFHCAIGVGVDGCG